MQPLVEQVEKDNKVTLDDNGVLEVIAKQLKQRKDSLPDYEKSGRDDLIADLKAEMDVLMEYLPKQLTAEELEVIDMINEARKAEGLPALKINYTLKQAAEIRVRELESDTEIIADPSVAKSYLDAIKKIADVLGIEAVIVK